MQPNFKRTSQKAFTEIKATPVVLVCIHNHNSTLITPDLLYSLFSKYGNVLRILIFEKMKVWKAFVEFSSLESAYAAKRNLDNYLLFHDGTRLNVYFSNLETIKFQTKNENSIDYTQPAETETQDIAQNFQNPTFPNNISPTRINENTKFTEMPIQRNEMIIPNNPYPRMTKLQESPNVQPYDDKGEDILKIINERQNEKPTEEEEKIEQDDQEKNNLFNTYMNVFQPQPQPTQLNQPLVMDPKPKVFTRPFEESDGFPRPQIIRHAGHKLTAPPGLALHTTGSQGNVFAPTNDNRRIPSQSSFNQFAPSFSPNKNGPSLFRPSSGQDLPRVMPTINASQFDPRQNMIPNNFSTFSFSGSEQNAPTQMLNPTLNLNVAMGSNTSQGSTEGNEGSPDAYSSQKLFEMIEKDLATDVNIKMKNLDLNPGHQPFIQPSEKHQSYGYEEPFIMQSNQTNQQSYPIQSDNPGIDDKKSAVLYVKGFEDPNITINMVYNLFGNFGNVLKLIFIRNKFAALLEYENADYANIAKDYLNNIILFGKQLRIFYANYSIVNMKHKPVSKDTNEEILVPNPKTYRFKKNKNISINPPSATLHISNLAQEVCNEESIKTFFSPYGTVLTLQFILKEGKWMCLMKLASIEESVNIMAILNDMPFGGRRVQLSFTRSKI